MLFFRSEEHVAQWCAANRLPQRPLVSLEQLWELSLEWYGTRLTREARRPKPDEMVAIFNRVGLRGEFWDPRSDRF